MKTSILKPDLKIYFASMPFIGRYMEYDYECANTTEELTALFHKWMNESESSVNLIRKRHFKSAAYYLHSLLTGKSYESKLAC